MDRLVHPPLGRIAFTGGYDDSIISNLVNIFYTRTQHLATRAAEFASPLAQIIL